MLVVVKYVVKEILPQFCPTFNGSNQGLLRSYRGVSNIWSSRTVLVFQLPKQARYQLRYTWIYMIQLRHSRRASCCGARHLRRRRSAFLIFSSACGTQNFLLAIRSRNFDHGACLPTRCFCHWQRSCAQPLPLARLPCSAPGGGRLAPQLRYTWIIECTGACALQPTTSALRIRKQNCVL